MADKIRTLTMEGGNAPLYEGDGRLKMARLLERRWPGVVTVDRRFQRPQHVINWRKFDTPLHRRGDVGELPEVDEYGASLRAVKPIKAQTLQRLHEDWKSR